MRSLALCAVILASVSALARADDAPRYEIGLDVWGTSVHGRVDSPAGEGSLHVPFSDLLRNLNAGLMGHARADWGGGWSLAFDGLWAKLRGDDIHQNIRLGPLGAVQVPASVESELDEWILELALGHRIFELGSAFSRSPSDTRRVRGEIYAGARYWAIDPKIKAQIGATRVRLGDRSDWVDPMLGLRFAVDLSSTVALQVSGDVGGFNIGDYCSDFTWSQLTALTWAFTESWSARFGYRFLDFHRDSGRVDQRIQVRGPLISVAYRF